MNQHSRFFQGFAILLFLSFTTTPLSAQTWNGSTSSDWADPTNWSTGSVPTAADNVTIPNRTNDPIILNGTDALALSVGVQGGAVLTIENGGSLTINGSPGIGLINNGSVQNHGSISLGATTNIGSTAIVNGGGFRNHPDGTIQVDGTNRPFNAGYGIQNNGGRTFINEGSIILGLNKKVGRSAIFNRGNFRNDTGGQVQIEACDIGIFVASGAINNSGTITIGSVKSPNTNGIESESTFNNNEGAVLDIGKNGSWSIFTTFGSTFNNRGLLRTGSIARGFRGIFTANNFTNFATGTIQCEASSGDAIKVNSGNFRNLGNITIGMTAQADFDGIANGGTFTNEEGGAIQIEKAGRYGIYTYGPNFFNDGKITIGQNNQPNSFGFRAIQSNFTNRACGEFIIYDNIEVKINSSFTNNGLLLIDTGNGHSKDGSPFINNGIISYQQSPVVPGVVNNEIIIQPTSATGCEPISSAFLLNQVDFNILGIFSDENATTSAGTYTQGNNTFVDDPALADGVTHTLFVNIKDPTGDCTRSVPWKLTIDDTTPPTFTCPSDRTVDVAAGNCQGVVPDFSTIIADAADNCGNVVIGQDIPANSTFGSGEGDQVVVTITADDGNGNVNATPCQVTLTVKDNEAPSLSCPTSINVNNDPGQCSAVVNFTVTATDNCDGSLAVTLNQNSGTLFNVGTTTINASATDAGGNVGNCSFNVIVKDNEAPTATCNDVTVTLSTNGEVALNPLNSGAITNRNDNCGVTGTVGSSQVIFTCDDLGSNTETILNVDVNGNSTTCDITVTVEDPNSVCNQPPIAKCQNITVSAEPNSCEASTSVSQINNGSNDPDGDPLQLTLDNNGPFAVGGPYTVELTVSDGSLDDKCTATVLVNDTQNPNIVCPADITVDNDPGQCGAAVNYNVTFGDNCPGAALIINPASGSFFGVGSGSVLATVTDAAGNIAQCGFNVIVQDNEVPSFSNCPGNILVNNDAGDCGANVSWTPPTLEDNCPGETPSSNFAPGDFFPIGSTTVTYTGSDAAGNDATACSFTVTVNDTEIPTFSNCPTNINLFNDFRECGAIATWTPPIFEDNCPEEAFNSTHIPGTFFDVGTTTVTYSGMDKAGNQAVECSFTVSITDNEKPRIACSGDVSTGTDPGVCGAEVKLITPIVTDNCFVLEVRARYRPVDENGGPLGSWSSRVADPSGFFSVGRYQVQWRVKDIYGNKETCSQYLTVLDDEDPLAVCKDFTIDFNGEQDINLTVDQVWNEAASSDNCGFVAFVSANLTIGCEELGNTVAIPVTIQDETGNIDVCTSYVDVIGLPCGWTEGPSDGSLNCDGQTTSEFDADNESFTLTSEGCWQSNQNPDQAAFVYQELCGDGSLTAEISDVNAGGYAGLMARESLDPLARRAGVLKNNSTRRVRREWRPIYDGPVVRTSSNRSRVKWLRIVRKGDEIKSYTSTNGSYWRLLYKVNFSNLEDCIYVGMMAYSLNGSAEVEGVFENVSLSGSGTLAGGILGDPAPITPEGLEAWGTVGDVGNGSIEVFPNPASDQTQLVLEEFQDKPAQLVVRDAFGKMIRQIALDSAMGLSMPLDLSNLAPGVYIISLIQDKQLKGSKRLVVQP